MPFTVQPMKSKYFMLLRYCYNIWQINQCLNLNKQLELRYAKYLSSEQLPFLFKFGEVKPQSNSC